jgi:hypothetical protein
LGSDASAAEFIGAHMGEVINAIFAPKQTDGGKARILRRRDNFKFRIPSEPIVDCRDDLIMDCADQADYMPSEYCAPVSDLS